MSLDNRDYMRDSRQGPDILANITPLKVILAVNIAVFVLQHMFEVWMTNRKEDGALSLDALADGHVWTIVTHLFVHGSVMHLVGNMMLVFFVGRALQSLLGYKSFVILYFLAGFAAAVAQLLFQHFVLGVPTSAGMIGASGAAFGLLLAFATMLPNEIFVLIFPIPMRVTAKNLGRAAIIISVVMLILDSIFKLSNIAHMAHLGGAIAGILYARSLGFGSGSRTYGGASPRPSSPRRSRTASAPSRSKVVDAKVVDAKVVVTQDYFSAEIDPILDKINRDGMGSLTESERKILQEGQRKISRKIDGK